MGILDNSYENNHIPIHERLYQRRNDKDNTTKKLKEKYKDKEIEKKKEEINNLTFKPQNFSFTNDKDELEQLYSNINLKTKPKGYDQYIKRNRNIIKKKEEEKKKEEDKYTGRNYDKIKKMDFNLPDINDMKYKKDSQKLCNKYYLTDPNYIKENEDNSDDDDSYIIEILIPNGKTISFKFNSNDDINEKVEELCKIYNLKDSIKQKLINSLEKYKNNSSQDES